ncbi:NAD-P-binding protein [Neolentinus lepideus HHB14362 ss-1]|uniref:NAD-P-binding protein n=1 Tax=Neolentinus lepideus HHB14362 ss-1 TaxID=1314782 RepID=A0A165SQA7_9AGAM|nr:NAD-P-binding protein [Neolentinus lepideus HHB14362 ss-1]
MSGFKHFAIAGAGNLGSFIAEEFLKLKEAGVVATVLILTRGSNESSQNLAALGATIALVDYTSGSDLASLLSKYSIDVLISTVSGGGYVFEPGMAKAALSSGVKLFLPAEFGVRSTGRTDEFLAGRTKLHKELEEMGLPYLLCFSGQWADWSFNPYFGWDIPNGKISIPGEGKTPISWTTRRDVGRFVAHILTTLPPDQFLWKTICIEGDRKSMKDIANAYISKTGKAIAVTHTPISELEHTIASEPSPWTQPYVLAWLQLAWDKGEGVPAKTEEEWSMRLWPEWKPKGVVEALLETYP